MKTRFKEEQIVTILQEAENGAKVKDITRSTYRYESIKEPELPLRDKI